MIRIRTALGNDAARVDAFYASLGKSATSSESRLVLIAEDEDTIIGAVRLCAEGGCLVLRTMVVREEYRHQGIGRRMLLALEEFMGEGDFYCLAYPHLLAFYGSVGFVEIAEDDAPDHIRERYARYTSGGMRFAIMKRPKGPARQ
jgi:N-acetylglutamate synthase-like GNAT family acetyltransferase